MKVDVLRAAQASILDESKLFDMGDWCHCIAAHILLSAGEIPEMSGALVAARAGVLAELTTQQTEKLFYGIGDRYTACRSIDNLIRVYAALSALESRSRSTRAEEPIEAEAELVGA